MFQVFSRIFKNSCQVLDNKCFWKDASGIFSAWGLGFLVEAVGFLVIEQRSFLCCFNFGPILIITKLAKIFSVSVFAGIKFRVISVKAFLQ